MAKLIRWEYKRLMFGTIQDTMIAQCDNLGFEGWELVGIMSYSERGSQATFIFKHDMDWQEKEDCKQDE